MAYKFFLRVVKVVGGLVLIAVACFAVLLASLWLDHNRSTPLPEPTGPYKVGRSTYFWTDPARLNPFASDSNVKQQLAVWIWYPAEITPSAQPTEYLPSSWTHAIEQHQGFVLTKLLSRDLVRIQTHSFADAVVSPEQPWYPVVILRAGGGALSTDFTSLAEDLTSHGYVVVSFDAPYRTVVMPLPDGRVVTRSAGGNPETMPYAEAQSVANRLMNAWIDDTQFVLSKLQQSNTEDAGDRLHGRLDLQHVGIVGHSLGGATAAQFCHDDDRCKAGIDIDGMPFGSVIRQGLQKPFLFVMSDHSQESGPEAVRVKSDIESIYNATPKEVRWQLTIVGANHFSFSDQMLTKSPILISILQRIRGSGHLERRRGLAITSACVIAFFDVYLKGTPPRELSDLSRLYPEVKPGITDAFPK